MEEGTIGAGKSGSALEEILKQINSVTRNVKQIATAAEQQNGTTNEINDTIVRLTEVVEETAKGVDETAATPSKFAYLAEDMRKLFGQFTVWQVEGKLQGFFPPEVGSCQGQSGSEQSDGDRAGTCQRFCVIDFSANCSQVLSSTSRTFTAMLGNENGFWMK